MTEVVPVLDKRKPESYSESYQTYGMFTRFVTVCTILKT